MSLCQPRFHVAHVTPSVWTKSCYL